MVRILLGITRLMDKVQKPSNSKCYTPSLETFRFYVRILCLTLFISICILSLVCGDYIRRVLDWQLDLLDHTQLHTGTVYTLLQLTTVHHNTCRVSLPLQLTLTTESRQGSGPPADPTGSHWPSTNSSGFFSATHRQLNRNWNCPCQSQSHFTTDDQSVSKSWIRAPCGSRDRTLISVWHLRVQSTKSHYDRRPVGQCVYCWCPSFIARERTTKKTPPKNPLLLHDVITGTDPKENNSSFHCCVA
jgi:hypothetical protein